MKLQALNTVLRFYGLSKERTRILISTEVPSFIINNNLDLPIVYLLFIFKDLELARVTNYGV